MTLLALGIRDGRHKIGRTGGVCDVTDVADKRIVWRRKKPCDEIGHGRLSGFVGRGNFFEEILQCTGIMTEQTARPYATVQVIPVTEPRAGRREVIGITTVKPDDVFRVCQPPCRMMRKTDLTVKTAVTGKTAYPCDAPIKIRPVTARTRIGINGYPIRIRLSG